jgi:hypothetical protein
VDDLLEMLARGMLDSVGEEAERNYGDVSWSGLVQASLVIKGEPARRLFVALDRDAALRLAGLVTGLDSDAIDADPTLAQDLAAEVANILAGNVQPALEGSYGLGLPEVGIPSGDVAGVIELDLLRGGRFVVGLMEGSP